jgi:hypothetical protein
MRKNKKRLDEFLEYWRNKFTISIIPDNKNYYLTFSGQGDFVDCIFFKINKSKIPKIMKMSQSEIIDMCYNKF